MTDILENIEGILKDIPDGVKLVAVSKTYPEDRIKLLYNNGYRIFGENKVQEICRKYENLPKDIEWHYIGHLQTNKIKYIAPFVSYIHGVDSIKLLKKINTEATKLNKTIKCMLQLHIAKEESKFGFIEEELNEALVSLNKDEISNIQIVGLMGMATYTDNQTQIRAEFHELKSIFNRLKDKFFIDKPEFKEISMGMSGDYKMAIEEGSTMVRVGSSIFGKRN